MCEINAIIKMNGSVLNTDDKIEFLEMLKSGSIENDDAWGYFTPSQAAKFTGNHINQNLKINKDDWFIVGHNRMATKGDPKDNKNNHPFWNDRYTMVHNGVIDNVDFLKEKYSIPKVENEIKTDSYIIMELMEKFGSECNYNTEETIKKVIYNLEGWYSIIIYDRKTDILYYIKDYLTEINVSLAGNDTIAMSTRKERIEYLYNDKSIFNFFSYNRHSKTFKDYHLYKITKKEIEDLGEVNHLIIDDMDFEEDNIDLINKIKSLLGLSEDELEDFLIEIDSYQYCNHSDNCNLTPEKCPIVELAKRMAIKDFICPNKYSDVDTSWESYSHDKKRNKRELQIKNKDKREELDMKIRYMEY